ncbi:hypothetical protein HELRODRAFT_192040 [Helobdella robusta]|uniref:Scavenger receptor class B member 1 n=1 Tax=Helobdella robusta TaxID=6412 RepID=T1FTJ2_HELRO|nr:hypothetical protein HELRODRAFT_192040 [Helobdella robusta]ESO03442.1 hypothetical protein HELRODRAFT_192040 [Helobdella robusta]
MSRSTVLAIFFVIGMVLLTVGVSFNYFFDCFVEKKLQKNLNLLNGTEAYANWLQPPVPVYMSFYFFNVTNYEEFSRGAKPVVQQVGPYAYREIRNKVNIVYSSNNESLSYKEQKFYTFLPTNILNESDVIYTLNIPVLVISKLLEKMFPEIILKLIGFILNGEKLIEKRTVFELLWGFNMSLADDINRKLAELHLPPIRFPTFGIYVNNNSNGSMHNEYNISTGAYDISQVGRINSWRGNSHLSSWSGDACNMINGTDGSFWHPLISESDTLYLFSPDLCRSMYMLYNSTTTIYQLNSMKYTVPETVLRDPRYEEANRCFCLPEYPHCLKAGVLDVSLCNDGAPVIVSLPHFLYGDAEYTDAVVGMKPNLALHQSYVHVEPMSGFVLEAHKRLQINFMLQKYTTFKSSWVIKEPIIFPLMWAEESASINERSALRLYSLLNGPRLIGRGLIFMCIVVGGLFVLVTIVVAAVIMSRKFYKCIPESYDDMVGVWMYVRLCSSVFFTSAKNLSNK